MSYNSSRAVDSFAPSKYFGAQFDEDQTMSITDSPDSPRIDTPSFKKSDHLAPDYDERTQLSDEDEYKN